MIFPFFSFFSLNRYILGHLLTAFDLFEEKRVRNQCQNLLQVARRLLGKIGECKYIDIINVFFFYIYTEYG